MTPNQSKGGMHPLCSSQWTVCPKILFCLQCHGTISMILVDREGSKCTVLCFFFNWMRIKILLLSFFPPLQKHLHFCTKLELKDSVVCHVGDVSMQNWCKWSLLFCTHLGGCQTLASQILTSPEVLESEVAELLAVVGVLLPWVLEISFPLDWIHF